MGFFVKRGDFELYPCRPEHIEKFERFNDAGSVVTKVNLRGELLDAYLSEKQIEGMLGQLNIRLRMQFIRLKEKKRKYEEEELKRQMEVEKEARNLRKALSKWLNKLRTSE